MMTTTEQTLERITKHSTESKSLDMTEDNIQQLKQIFPEAFQEGKIDFTVLQALLGEHIDDSNERYNFTWNGKNQARQIAQTPTTGTLRPCPEDSVNWDNTDNLFIEGDNLEVLKLLQKSYHKKVKMIYIDPPYNTGKDFVYKDNFRDNMSNYLEQTGQVNGEGRKLSTNPETSGRYHSDWLNMMYPRLKLARNLLKDDGVIFISIDDNEQKNLKALCDEVFGEDNFINNVIWQKKYAPANDAKWLSDNHDFILCYAKDKQQWRPNLLPRSEEAIARYKNPDNDPRGVWKAGDLSVKSYSKANDYPITTPSGRVVHPPASACWRVSQSKLAEMIADNRIWFGKDGNNVPAFKRFLSEVKDGVTAMTVWTYSEVGHNQAAKQELKKIFPETKDIFDTPKPVSLLTRLLDIGSDKDSLILDFFAGSGTTAHAVMAKNQTDQGQRRFITVQLPEPTGKTDFDTISDFTLERIKRVGVQTASNGVKKFKLDTTNIKPWDTETTNVQASLENAVESIKLDRTEEDVLYEILLKYGLELTTPVETVLIEGKKIFNIGFGALIVCLADDISLELIEGIAQLKQTLETETMHVVFKDAGFASSQLKTNAMQILKQAGIDDVKSI
jgi:adenine-specific DNA-methyltransferase